MSEHAIARLSAEHLVDRQPGPANERFGKECVGLNRIRNC